MNHQTTGGAHDVSAHIGALELGAINSFDDSALETSVYAGPQRQTAIRLPGGGCLPGIDDSALEATVHAGPSTRLRNGPVCLNIDDSVLESTVHAGPSTRLRNGPVCLNINDSELEASALSMGPPPNATMQLQCLTRVGCSRIDDGALEAIVHAGPGPSFPPSLPPMCRRIDDGVLEASIQVGPGPSGLTRFPTCMPRIDDGALEQAAARVEVGPTNRMVANRCM